MASYAQGKAVVFGTSATSSTPGTFTLYPPTAGSTAVTGYVAGTVSGINVNHAAESSMIKNQDGDVDAVITHGEYLEATFEIIASGTTKDLVKLHASLPEANSTLAISGLEIIPMGPFSDGLNVSGASLPLMARWIYTGGASVRLSTDGHATISLPVKRFPALVGATAFSG